MPRFLPLLQPLAAGLLALSLPLTLAGCAASASPQSSAGDANPDFSAAVVLSAYELPDGSCEIRYPSGEVAAVLDADDAFRGFPGRSPASSEVAEDASGVPAYFGQAPDGTLYAVTCSGPSAGSSRCNVLLSTDAGESWTVTGEEPFSLSMVTGAGFQSAQVGFLCSRYFQDSGPEIYLTRDGGESWARLDLDRPARAEAQCRQLWRRFLQSVAGDGAANPALRQTDLPRRFRGEMADFHAPCPPGRGISPDFLSEASKNADSPP